MPRNRKFECSVHEVGESSRSCRSRRVPNLINFVPSDILPLPTYFDDGDCEYICKYCRALFWFAERIVGGPLHARPRYTRCCKGGVVRLPLSLHALSGHENTVCSVFTRPTDPQVITGSHDSTIKLWDLRYGKAMATLTHHKKSVRALAPHPTEDCFVSASAENIKKFKLPKGEFMHNMLSQQKTIINSAAVNEEGVHSTAGDNGSLWFWDWTSGHNFQQAQTIVQPGSLDSEAGIYSITYDLTGSRLITCEADKTIKMWKEDEMATPETHPLHFNPPKDMRRF